MDGGCHVPKAEVPSAETEVPSAEAEVPSAETEVPSAETEVPSAEAEVPSAEQARFSPVLHFCSDMAKCRSHVATLAPYDMLLYARYNASFDAKLLELDQAGKSSVK